MQKRTKSPCWHLLCWKSTQRKQENWCTLRTSISQPGKTISRPFFKSPKHRVSLWHCMIISGSWICQQKYSKHRFKIRHIFFLPWLTKNPTNKQKSPNKLDFQRLPMFIHSKSPFFLSLKRKNDVQLEKRLFYQGKICFFWMVLNDGEKAPRTNSNNQNPLFFFFSKSLLPKSAVLIGKSCTLVAGTKPVSCKDGWSEWDFYMPYLVYLLQI